MQYHIAELGGHLARIAGESLSQHIPPNGARHLNVRLRAHCATIMWLLAAHLRPDAACGRERIHPDQDPELSQQYTGAPGKSLDSLQHCP